MSIFSKIPGVKEIPGVKGGHSPSIPGVNEAKNAINSVKNEAVKEIRNEGKKVLSNVGGELEHLIVQALLKLGEEATKPALSLAAEVVTLADNTFKPIYANKERAERLNKAPFVLPITLGAVSLGLYWYNVFGGGRASGISNKLKQYSRKGIGTKRHEIIQACRDFGPDHIDIGVGAQISLGIQFGITPSIWSLPTEDFLLLADKLMKKAGVPA